MTKPTNASLSTSSSNCSAPRSATATSADSAGTMTTPSAAATEKRSRPGTSWVLKSGRAMNMARMRGCVRASVPMNALASW